MQRLIVVRCRRGCKQWSVLTEIILRMLKTSREVKGQLSTQVHLENLLIN